MAGGHVKYRHLSRDSAARKALLRSLVTNLVAHEHILTTHAKAKEAQRMAEKLISLAKRNNEPCRRSAQAMLYVRPPVRGAQVASRRQTQEQIRADRCARPPISTCRSCSAKSESAT